MFRLIRFAFRTIIFFKFMALAFSAGMGAAYLLQLRQQYRTWGVVDGDTGRSVRGDELVAEADLVETRAVDIDAAPDRVWPWLAQLGYGRGGWYSYSALDRPWAPTGGRLGQSSDTILDEFQDLAEGDLVPTHPQGGFEARVVEPGKALVLYLDDVMTREQFAQLMTDVADATEEAEEAAEELEEAAEELGEAAEEAGLAVEEGGERGASVDLDVDWEMPPYQVTWAFELEELPGGRTRLVERLRAHIEATEMQWRARPFLGLGAFALMRSQMLGLKQRAERVEPEEVS
ncbi:MAG: hypothetical protein PVH07_11220 [Chloroflexota bacterium]|jgi:hypothetical protein